MSVYKQAVMLGMIDDGKDSEKEALKQENKNLKKDIVRLREQLGIQEEIDNPLNPLSVKLKKKMTNLFRCQTCNSLLTAEESKDHLVCNPKLKKYKTISTSSYFTSKNDDGESCIVIDGLDNVGYTFVIKDPKLMPVELLCDSYQPKGNRHNNQPSSTQNHFKKLLACTNQN